jgi:hypothetical protein
MEDIMDGRIEQIMSEQELNDKSFLEKDSLISSLFGTNKYTKYEIRETWFRGIRHGLEIGLHKASLEGQKIELGKNTGNEKHQEFIRKYYELAEEYGCAIQYHPVHGMTIVVR